MNPTPTLWLTGLSGAGKSTLARGVMSALAQRGRPAQLLDADQVRVHLGSDLGFDRRSREENVRRLAYVAGLLSRHGILPVVAAISPYWQGREQARQALQPFLEVFVDAPVAICEQRDPVGLYGRFRRGEIRNVSGLDDIYEAPIAPEVHCRTEQMTLAQCLAAVLEALDRQV